jgi:hypothetical protein
MCMFVSSARPCKVHLVVCQPTSIARLRDMGHVIRPKEGLQSCIRVAASAH